MKITEAERLDNEEAARRLCNIMKAREAIIGKIGPFKKRISLSATGRLDCPVCGGKDALHYRRAASNGHISGCCDTKDCVQWME